MTHFYNLRLLIQFLWLELSYKSCCYIRQTLDNIFEQWFITTKSTFEHILKDNFTLNAKV